VDRSILRPHRWLFAPGSPRQLAALRIGLCTVLALRLGLRPDLYLSVADQPAALFRPLSFMKLLGHMPSRGIVLALLIVGTAAALIAAGGLRGKVVHNDVLLLLCLFCLVPARHGDAWSLDAWLARRRAGAAARPVPEQSVLYGWPVRLAMLLVAGTYCLTGLHKLQYSGIAWAGDNLRWVLYTASDSQNGNGLSLFVANHPLLAHLFAAGTLVLEVGFPIVLLWPAMRWLFVPGVVSLHAGIYATMRLNYVAMAATVVIVYVHWPSVVAWVQRRRQARGRLRAAPART